MKASTFFSAGQQEAIVRAIAEAEARTSGEIRVHIGTSCRVSILDEAAWLFRRLGMHRTSRRNGVLFYIALRERSFAIIGDSGINEVAGQGFWNSVRDHMERRFSEGLFAEGLSEGILMAGEKLKEHFPHTDDDVNELPDTISYDIPETEE